MPQAARIARINAELGLRDEPADKAVRMGSCGETAGQSPLVWLSVFRNYWWQADILGKMRVAQNSFHATRCPAVVERRFYTSGEAVQNVGH
ncbi:MAG: hypothetical protein KJO30_06665 [Boseongicola sp.]|nr:hypothetical protein [Boseongicola sp.]NNJ68399.1 hypothetical protein [Boseongicola sp.]